MLWPFVSLSAYVAHGHQNAPTVTLQATESVAKLAHEMSDQSGQRITADGKAGREILIVAVNNVPLDDLKKQIAWATYCRWQDTPNGSKLVEDPGAAKAAERHYVRWQAHEAATAIDRYRTGILKEHLVPARTPWEHHESKILPLDRAMVAALAQIKPDQVIFTDPDFLPTFAENPTPAQLPFADQGKSILTAYNAGIKNPAVQREAVHAILTCQYKYELGSANLQLFDSEGQLVDSFRAQLPLYGGKTARPLELADRIPRDAQVPLSEASLFFRTRFQGGINEETANEIAARLREPEKFEPLAGFATDAWRTVAEIERKNLVANVDDMYLDPAWAYQPPRLADAFKMAGGYNAETSSNWIVARPSLPTPPWHHRIDRVALGRLLRAKHDGGAQSFLAWSEFAADGPLTPDSYAMTQYLGWSQTPAPRPYEGWFGPRVYGCLTQTQKDLLASGQPIPLSDLPDESKRALIALTMQNGMPPQDLPSQPTVRFAAGFPADAVLRQEFETDLNFIVRPTGDPNSNQNFLASVPQLAAYLKRLAQAHPEDVAKVGLAEQIHTRLSLTASLHDPRGDIDLAQFNTYTDGRSYTWPEAPEDVRQQVLAAANKG